MNLSCDLTELSARRKIEMLGVSLAVICRKEVGAGASESPHGRPPAPQPLSPAAVYCGSVRRPTVRREQPPSHCPSADSVHR